MLSTLDYGIIVVYLGFVLCIGILSCRGNKTSEDYYMAGRSISWFPIAMSVAATMLSANSLIGGPGWAYSDGLFPFMVNITVPLAVGFVLCTTLPVCYHLKLTSIYEYVELRLGPRTRLLTVLCFFANALIQIGSMIFIPSLIISTFTGWQLSTIIPIVVITAVLYTLIGGMRAVIWTDVAQMLITWVGLGVIVWIIFDTANMNLPEAMNKARAAGKLASLDFSLNLDAPLSFWATLVGGFVMWTNYFGFNQVQIQRVLTAKSLGDAKRSLVNSSIIMNVMYFICMMLGVWLFVMYDGRPFDNANAVMIDFISTHMWKGFVGLMVAGIFAASMSSVDSLLNSMSTVFTKDVYEKHFNAAGATSLRVSMLISLAFGVLITVVTILGFSQTTRSVLDVVGNYISYISGPMASIYMLAFFVPKANDRGVTLGSIAGFILVMVFCSMVSVGWLWKPALGFAFSFTASLVGSFCYRSDPERKQGRHYTVLGVLRELRASGKTTENGLSTLPFVFDRYCAAALGFFLIQYLLLYAID